MYDEQQKRLADDKAAGAYYLSIVGFTYWEIMDIYNVDFLTMARMLLHGSIVYKKREAEQAR